MPHDQLLEPAEGRAGGHEAGHLPEGVAERADRLDQRMEKHELTGVR